MRKARLNLRTHTAMVALMIGASAAVTAAQAQQAADSDTIETVTVLGVRGAEQKAIDIKRDASSIEDSIAAEDIGKLPDTTIADSLQRITGVQIDRSGGEGTTVEVRGLPEVGTLLNGEAFLTTGTIDSVQPNFTDIPSQLFAGADVVKSPTASLLGGGITGTINLKTRRPEDLQEGWTLSGSADTTHGFTSDKWEPEANALVGYNAGKWGVLISGSYDDVTLENNTNGQDVEGYGGKFTGEADSPSPFLNDFNVPGWPGTYPPGIVNLGGGNADVNGDGVANGAYWTEEDFAVWQNQIERKRIGFNASFQGDLGEGFSVTSDFFYTHMDQYNRKNGYQLNSSNWQGATFVPDASTEIDTGTTVSGPWNNNQWASPQEVYIAPVETKYLGDMENYSEDDVTTAESRNWNFQLNYDDGGRFTGDIRAIYADAHSLLMQSYVQFTDADGAAWGNGASGSYGTGTGTTYFYPSSAGGDRVFNPNGFAPNTVPVTIDTRGQNLAISLPSNLAAFAANGNDWVLKTVSSENNQDQFSSMSVLRADGHYTFGESGVKIDFGVRQSLRNANSEQFNMIAPVWAGDAYTDTTSGGVTTTTPATSGCYVHWKAADVLLNDPSCYAGNGTTYAQDQANGFYRAGALSAQNITQLPAILQNAWHQYSNLGGVNGVTIWNLNPAAMDNVLAFQNALYPGEVRDPNPGATWAVDVNQTQGYLQGSVDGTLYYPFNLNIGVRFIKTNLTVDQHTPNSAQPRPYGLNNTDLGITQTTRSFTDVLPAANLAVDVTDDFKVRLAYSKNMELLNLDQWGGALQLNYAIDNTNHTFDVTGGSQNGNPDLEPWRSTNYDASFEYYIGRASMVNLAFFYIDVASFIVNGAVTRCDIPDQDGVVRRCVSINSQIQGAGKDLKGVEAGWKQAFDFLPGFWGNFGSELNFTYSPSNTGTDLAGNTIPFQDNSREQANFILYYQDSAFQARIAGNYRSLRAVSQNPGGVNGLEEYQAPTFYLDASASYNFDENWQLFVQGSNLTGEHERYYFTWPSLVAKTIDYETRLTTGIRVHF